MPMHAGFLHSVASAPLTARSAIPVARGTGRRDRVCAGGEALVHRSGAQIVAPSRCNRQRRAPHHRGLSERLCRWQCR
jgi:hypothetical protein